MLVALGIAGLAGSFVNTLLVMNLIFVFLEMPMQRQMELRQMRCMALFYPSLR